MKKNILIILAIAFMGFACQQKAKDTTDKTAELASSKAELKTLQEKIRLLESQLAEEDHREQGILVRTQPLKPTTFEHFFEASGYVEAVEAAYISPEINGQVKQIYVKEGQRVKKGQELIRLNTSIVENSIKEVETALELAQTIFKKQKALWDKEIGSEIEYLQAKNNVESLESKLATLRSQLDMALITSPFDGIIDEIFVKTGELAIPGVQLMQLVNLSEVFINADLSETFLGAIKTNDMVDVSFPAYPDLKMVLPIFRLGEVINPQNRTFTMQLRTDNPNEKLKPNMLAIIKVRDFITENALVVPSILIRKDLKGEFIYIVERTKNGQFAAKHYITSGRSYNDLTMITKGLNPDDELVTEGYQIVTDGVRVKVDE